MMIRLLYITCANKPQALHIARALVQEKLVACANIWENVDSIYLWQGNLVEEKEVILIAKTTEEKVQKVIEKVKAMHSYDIPCVVALPIVAGNEAYLEWVKTVVS